MKKNLFVAAAMMVAMTACVKEADVVTPQENEKIWVEFTAGVQTKVVLNDGETDTVTWEEEDVISVNGVEFTIPEGDDAISADGKSAKFGASVGPSFLEAENFTAVYPATAAEWDGLAPQITVPVAQDGSADIVAMATVEKLTETLNFKHVVSFIKFQVPSSVETVTVSATEVIAGTVEKVAFAEEEGVTVVSYDAVSAEGNKTITVSLGADAEFEPGTFYYVAVLPGMKTNLTLSFDGATYKTWETLNIKQGMIAKVSAKKERNLAYKLADEVVTEVTYVMGTEFVALVLTGETAGVEYSSSNDKVATVDAEGVVTVLAAGETVITATAAENNTFLAGTASYTLTVSPAPRVERNLAFTPETVTITYGEEFTAPELTGETAGVEYSSSEPEVATVTSAGVVEILKAGTTTITASAEANDTHLAGSASYTLTVNKAARTLSFSPTTATAIVGKSFTAPVLSGVLDGETVVYTSSKESVATVTADGTVTLVAAGETTITATIVEDDKYLEGSAEYTLSVKKLSGYSIIGSHISWSFDNMTPLYDEGDYYVARNVVLTSTTTFKFIKSTATSWSGAENYGSGVAATVNNAYKNWSSGGDNSLSAGSYDIYLSTNKEFWFVVAAGTVVAEKEIKLSSDAWGVVGNIKDNSWSTNVSLYVSGKYLVAKSILFASATAEFKIRQWNDWNSGVILGTKETATKAINTKISLDGGNNVKVNVSTSKKYDVYTDLKNVIIVESGSPVN